jgi:Ca2+-binding EF-hand superfamily protein
LAAQCHLPPEQVKQLVKAFQKKNKKGKPINRDVFMHVLSKLDYSLRAKSPLLVNHENLDVLFSMLDVNHDGALDVSEVVLGLSILAMGSLEEKAELVFKAMDLDNNGTLNRAEVAKQFDKLLAVFQKEMTGEIMRVLYEKYRSVPSKTTIDAVMTPALAPVREMFATQGIAFVFQDVDTDKDDQISLVEWKAAVEKNEMVQWLICPERYVEKVKGETVSKFAAILKV